MAGGGFVVDRLSTRDVRNKLRVPAIYASPFVPTACGGLVLPEGDLQFALIAAEHFL
jgi:hypothetical protein